MDMDNDKQTRDPREVGDTVTSRIYPSRDIGWAVKQMWNGQAVCRRGWNGRGMHLRIQTPDANSANTLPYVWMKTADGNRVPWLCSQTDLLSTDWEMAEI